jgi:hypothetical protein
MKESPLFLLARSAFAFALFGATAAQAQVSLALPDISIGSAGTVTSIARQSDGSLIVGGLFTRIDGVPRSNLARLHPDGTLDVDWKPVTDGFVSAVVVDANDDVIVGGSFDAVGGVTRRSFAKIAGHGGGATDAGWNPGAELRALRGVTALAIAPDDGLIAAGEFADDEDLHRNLVKFGSGGALDRDWNPSVDSDVTSLAIDPAGAVYVGTFGTLRKFSTGGHGDAVPGWQVFGGVPWRMAVAADGSLYVGFALGVDIGFNDDRYLLRFPPGSDGSIDVAWQPAVRQSVGALALDGGAVYASLEEDSQHPAAIVKVATSAGAAEQWRTSGRGIEALTTGHDHSLYVGGHYEGPGGSPPGEQAKLSIARIASANAAPLATVDATVPGSVTAIARQSNGGTIVGGQFSRAGTAPRRNLLRLAPDGTLDPDWAGSFDYYAVLAIAVDERDDVYVAGDNLLSLERVPVLKFSGGSGAIDPHWNVSTDGTVSALAPDRRGSIYVGGTYSSIAGVARQNVAKLATDDATPDATWVAATVDPVQAILVDDPNAVVYIGSGSVGHGAPGSGVGTVYQGAIAKVSDSSGAAADEWPLPLAGIPRALASAIDGSVYAAGTFVIDADAPPIDALKVTPYGFVDIGWARGLDNADLREGLAIAVDVDDAVYIGGTHDPVDDGVYDGMPYLMKRHGRDGTRDAGWSPAIIGDAIRTLQLESDADGGTLYLGGEFSAIGDAWRGSLAALPLGSTESGTGHSAHARPLVVPPQPVPSPGRLRPAVPAVAQQASLKP